MTYYIAEIRFNKRSKDMRREKKVKKRLVTRLFTLLLACLLVLTPILIVQVAVGSDQSGVIEALKDLREDVLNLPPDEKGFNNPQAAEGQRKALSNKINAVINQVKARGYSGAINKLENDLRETISKWVTDERASSLIEKVNSIIELILAILKPPVHDIAITNVTAAPTNVHVGDPIYIDVTVANEGTASETFDIYVYADVDSAVIGDEITVDTITDVSLEAENSTTLSVNWGTLSVAEGIYIISAKVPPVGGEEDIDDNLYIDGTVVVSPALEHDVAVIGVSAPEEVTQGDVVTISVDVANPGNSDETFDVTVTYNTTPIGTLSVTLGSKDSETVPFTWNTTGVDPDTYTITAEAILAEDEDSTNNKASATITVKPELKPPVASFTYSPDTPKVGETTIFNASASYDSDGTIANWNWDFGDGTGGTGEIVEHAYVDAGTVTVTLTVTDDDGLNGTDTADITVSPALKSPVASFAENATTVLTGEVIQFDASESYDPDGTIVSYLWDFGDGTNGSGVTVGHSYADNGAYPVTLTVKDDDNLTGSHTEIKTIENRPPVPEFTQSVATVKTEETTTFDASESYDPDGTIESYVWDFGDGKSATGVEVSHAYEDDDNYTVTLTVTDDDGTTGSKSITKTVLNRPPTALFTQNATIVDLEEAIHFDASGSFDPDGDIVEYLWDFGDNTTEIYIKDINFTVTTTHTYPEAGNCTVTLKVTDDDGATSSFSVEITVEALPELPWALFAAVGLGIVAAAATVIYLWYRRRRKKATASAAASPSGPGTKPAVTLYIPANILTGRQQSR